jgi:hypothetical protein
MPSPRSLAHTKQDIENKARFIEESYIMMIDPRVMKRLSLLDGFIFLLNVTYSYTYIPYKQLLVVMGVRYKGDKSIKAPDLYAMLNY